MSGFNRELMIEACAGALTLWGVPRQIGRNVMADRINNQPCEPADNIWSLHSKCRLLTEEVIDSDIVRVLRLAMEALSAAGSMADARNLKQGKRL